MTNLENIDDDDVVISGMSLHLPGLNSYEKLVEMLMSGQTLNSPLKENIPRGAHGNFPVPGQLLESSNELDSVFFGMNNIVFNSADRNQIKCLESSIEALIDAGFTPASVKGLIVDVFQNTTRADGEYRNVTNTTKNRYMVLGLSRTLAPNRVSFHLDFRGESVAVDSSQTGSMQSLELGWRDVKSGRCDMAVVCCANIFIDEAVTAQIYDKGWLSNDGKTRAFDNDASGYHRSEALIAFVLQRAKTAKRIYTRVLHVNCRTETGALSCEAPTKDGWKKFLRESYEESGISKEKICYLEAYGSGMKDWDTEELNAVAEIFRRDSDDSLLIGSVKSNIGHTEGASDMMSIIKAIVSFQNGKIPGNLNYSSPNASVPALGNGQLKVADQNIDLPKDSLIAINGYSFGNTYGHCVLAGFNKPKSPVIEIPRLVPLSARLDDFLPGMFKQIEDSQLDVGYINLVSDIFIHRFDKHLGRGYMILSSGEAPITMHEAWGELVQPLWFVFSGMGSQWPGMGRDLMTLPLARASIEKCHDIILPKGLDVINIITSEDPDIFKDNLNSFVGIATVQIALVDVLNALKVIPDGIIGHSLGELGCAYADGSLNLEQTILAAYYRGKAVKDATLEKGAMAAVGKGYEQLKNSLPENVEVACHNSNASSTISGLEESVFKYVEELKSDSVFAKIVEVGNIGFHSKFIAPAGPYLLSYMKQVIEDPKLRSSKWVSSSVPEADWKEAEAKYSSAEYFTNNLLRSVLFEEASSHVPENAILVEIAPHGLLQAILKRSFPKATNISLTSRTAKNNLIFLLQAIGKLYMTGLSPDINALYPKSNYPVATNTKSLHGLFPWCTTQKVIEPTITSTSAIEIRSLMKEFNNSVEGHLFRGMRITPFAYYPFLVWHAYYQADPTVLTSSFTIRDLRIHDPFEFSIEKDISIEGVALVESNNVELSKDDKLFCSASAKKKEEDSSLFAVHFDADREIILNLSKNEIYDLLEKQGYVIVKKMQFLTSVEWTTAGLRGTMRYTNDWEKKLEAMLHLVYLNIIQKEDHLLTIKAFGRIEIIKEQTEEEISLDLELLYDLGRNELSCQGLYAGDISYMRHTDQRTLSLSSIVPYIDSPLKTLPEYLNFCYQVIHQCNSMLLNGGSKILEIDHKEFSPLAPVIGSCFPNIKIHQVSTGGKFLKVNGMGLVICSSQYLRENAKDMENFVLVRGNSSTGEFEDVAGFSVVSTYSSGEKLVLLKRNLGLNYDNQFIPIPIKESDLLITLKRHQITHSNAVLVGGSEPSIGILNFISLIQSQTSLDLKWLFILDESAPKFNPELPFYRKQLEKGLFLNVLLNGSWNFVFKKQLQANTITGYAVSKATSLESSSSKIRTAISDEKAKTVNFDSELRSLIPDSWNEIYNKDEIVKAYALAYHCFAIKAFAKSHDRIIVTDGCTLRGQAAIAVAFTITNSVIATVASEDEAEHLKTVFPELCSSNILLHTEDHFVLHLKYRMGDSYPNVVYNLLEGPILHHLLSYAVYFSTIFYFGRDFIENNYKMGTYSFLHYVKFFGVSSEGTAYWPKEEKLKVLNFIEGQFKSGAVKPLKSLKTSTTTSGNNNIIQLSTKCHRSYQFNLMSDGMYLIIGDSSHVDLEIAQWLATRKAGNIKIYNPLQSSRNDYKGKLSLLQAYNRNANIQTSNEYSLKELLTGINKDGFKLDAVFLIHLVDEDPCPEILFIDEALNNSSTDFVAISRNRQHALKLHRMARHAKSWTNIIWNTHNFLIKFNMEQLTDLIRQHALFSVDEELNLTDHKLNQTELVSELLPTSVDSIESMGASLVNSSTLIEITTSGPKMANSTLDCQPIFLFAGVEGDPVETASFLVSDVLGPAFLALFPCGDNVTIQDIATSIIPEILRVAKRKVYNLVGLSMGCIVALEVARQMEENGAVVALVLVDNPIQYLQHIAIKTEVSSIILDVFESFNQKPKKGQLQGQQPWAQRLNDIVSAMELPPESNDSIRRAASHISNFITSINKYDISELHLNGPLSVIRGTSISDELPYSKICSNNYVEDFPENHRKTLKSPRLTKLLNKFVVLEDVALVAKKINEVTWVPFEETLEKFRKVISQEIKVDW